MKTSRFCATQIMSTLEEHDTEKTALEVCPTLGISHSTMHTADKLKNGEHYRFKGKLSSLIDCVFIETHFSRVENQGVCNRIVPDNTVELILTDKKFERRFSDKKGSQTFRSHLSGLKTKWQDILLEGSPLISIRFKPEIIYQLSHISAAECRNEAIVPTDIFGKNFVHFEDELFSLNTTIERLQLIEDYFTAILIKTELKEDRLFQWAKESVDMTLGNIKINQLATHLKISQKSLENKFNRYIGLTPKQYCRLVRFIAIIKNYNSARSSFTSLAYENSFFDQSHFIKEIQHYTGFSPSAYFSQSKGVQEDIF